MSRPILSDISCVRIHALSAITAQHSTGLGLEVRPMVIRDLLRDDELNAWIADARAPLDRGELTMLGPVDVGHGTQVLSAQDTVRIMLADWTISRT